MPGLDPKHFLLAPNGSMDFGMVEAGDAVRIGVRAGPVRLQRGFPGNKGYGNLHVESYADRVKQFANLGYGSFVAFAFDVAQKYVTIGDGRNGRLSLIHCHMGYDLQLIVQHDPAGFWGVTTGLPYRVARCRILVEVTRTGGSELAPDAAEKRPRFATLSLPKHPKVSGGSGS